MLCVLCGQIVPKAIHNPVAIKLLVPGLLSRHMLCSSVLHHNRFCITILISSVQVLSFLHLIDRGGCHA